jgi:hypothetical protein
MIIFTILSVSILQTKFSSKQKQWDMIVSKAKKWLRNPERNIEPENKKEFEMKA